jgi:hypothetical protein
MGERAGNGSSQKKFRTSPDLSLISMAPLSEFLEFVVFLLKIYFKMKPVSF